MFKSELILHYTGNKRKNKEGDITPELLSILAKLDEQADARMEERERKRMLLEAELEEKRREQERRHEERMQTMMFGFFQKMMEFSPMPSRQSHSPHGTFQHPSFPSTSFRFPGNPAPTYPQFPPTSSSYPLTSPNPSPAPTYPQFTPSSYPLTSPNPSPLHSSTFEEDHND